MAFECPKCDREFDSEKGKKIHHTQYHVQGKTDEEMLEDLRGVADKLGRTPTKNDLIGRDDCYTTPMYRDRFGSWNDALREAGLEINHDENASVSLECDYCSDKFERVPYRLEQKDPDNVFCSNECRVEWLSDKTGENALGWIDGRFFETDYSRAYNGTFRENRARALERDEYECQACGMTNQEHKDQHGTSLHIHHIQPVASFETHDEAHELRNLVSLCVQCHRKWEGVPLKPQFDTVVADD